MHSNTHSIEGGRHMNQYPPQQPGQPWPPQHQAQQHPPSESQPYQQPYYPQPGPLPPNWLEIERTRAAAAKSYTNKAMFTLLLYIFLWVPGLIANLLYLREAYQTRELTGTSPDGWGCLWTLLIVGLSPTLLFSLWLFAMGLAAGAQCTGSAQRDHNDASPTLV